MQRLIFAGAFHWSTYAYNVRRIKLSQFQRDADSFCSPGLRVTNAKQRRQRSTPQFFAPSIYAAHSGSTVYKSTSCAHAPLAVIIRRNRNSIAGLPAIVLTTMNSIYVKLRSAPRAKTLLPIAAAAAWAPFVAAEIDSPSLQRRSRRAQHPKAGSARASICITKFCHSQWKRRWKIVQYIFVIFRIFMLLNKTIH